MRKKVISFFVMMFVLNYSNNAIAETNEYQLIQIIDNVIYDKCSSCVESMENKMNEFYDNNIRSRYNIVFEFDRLVYMARKYIESKNEVFLSLRVFPQRKKIKDILND